MSYLHTLQVKRRAFGGEGRQTQGIRDGVKPVAIPEFLCTGAGQGQLERWTPKAAPGETETTLSTPGLLARAGARSCLQGLFSTVTLHTVTACTGH